MLKKIFSSADTTNLSTVLSYLKGSTFSLLLALSIAAAGPVAAKEASKTDAPKEASKKEAPKNDATRAEAPKKGETKDQATASTAAAQPKAPRGASFVDAAVGAKTTAELVKKLSDAYMNKDDVAYLALVKAPMRTRIRLHQQFRRDSNKPTSEFKFLTVADEAARLKITKDAVSKPETVNGTVEGYEYPLAGFVTFDTHSALAASAPKMDKPGIAVAKIKDAYFIITRQPVEGATPTAAAPPAPPAASAPAKAH